MTTHSEQDRPEIEKFNKPLQNQNKGFQRRYNFEKHKGATRQVPPAWSIEKDDTNRSNNNRSKCNSNDTMK